jgi:hypothetical protein
LGLTARLILRLTLEGVILRLTLEGVILRLTLAVTRRLTWRLTRRLTPFPPDAASEPPRHQSLHAPDTPEQQCQLPNGAPQRDAPDRGLQPAKGTADQSCHTHTHTHTHICWLNKG